MINQNSIISCPVCKCVEFNFYISTNALMHSSNTESYLFNRCKNCEAVYLANRLDEEQLVNYYTDNYLPYKGPSAWGKYSSFVSSNQKKVDAKRVNFVKGIVDAKKDLRVLDLGCGNPSFLNLLRQTLQVKCTGIDFSDSGWKGNSFENLELIKTSLAEYQPKQLYDVITLWHYLEHDYNLLETEKKLYEWLKPGGKLIIEVPDYKSITARLQKQYWQGWHSPRHLTLFSEKSFGMLFPNQRWHVIKHLRYGTLDAFTLWWLGKMEQKKIDWTDSMEKEFWPLVFLKILSFPMFLFERLLPMGIQLLVIEKKQLS